MENTGSRVEVDRSLGPVKQRGLNCSSARRRLLLLSVTQEGEVKGSPEQEQGEKRKVEQPPREGHRQRE